jgi:diadenosine tetraphosphate (Ap4A) HIT family hydrolase
MIAADSVFAPDPRIAADSAFLIDLALCQARMMDDVRFPWLVLLPRRAGLVELTDLSEPERAMLMEEAALCSKALKASVPCDKINIGALGNVVPQLHVHVVARTRGDAAWPGPVWGSGPAIPYAPGAMATLTEKLVEQLGAAP